MSIKKTIKFTTNEGALIHPPIGEQPEGNLDSLNKLEDAMKKLFKTMDTLKENLNKLTEENQRLKDALGITENMEEKNEH